MKTVYQIKETCPMWNDGTGVPYEKILDYVFLDKEVAEKCKSDLDNISDERVLCTEYEIIEANLIENLESYEENDKYDVHGWDSLESIGREF